jgi:hypothetical protein
MLQVRNFSALSGSDHKKNQQKKYITTEAEKIASVLLPEDSAGNRERGGLSSGVRGKGKMRYGLDGGGWCTVNA